MIKDIINGISVAIKEEFGESYNVYTESKIEGMIQPYFYLTSMSAKRKPKVSSRTLFENTMGIQYITSHISPNSELYEVYERLTKCLEYITVNDELTRSLNNKVDFFERMFRYSIDFNIDIISCVDKSKMETMELGCHGKS